MQDSNLLTIESMNLNVHP